MLPDDVNLPPPLALFGRVTAPLRRKANGVDGDAATRRGSPPRSPRSGRPTSSSASSSPPATTSSAASSPPIFRPCRTGCRLSRKVRPAQAVEEALGARIDKLFAEFGPPVAAASIAQVHKAETKEPGRLAPPRRRQGAAARHRAALPAGPRQLFLRRAHDRAPASAVAALAADRRGRHAGQVRRHRDGFAHGGGGHLRDGREHQGRRGLPRAKASIGPGARAAC